VILPDDIAQQVQSLSHPSEFIVELLRNALPPAKVEESHNELINKYNLPITLTQRVPGLGNGDIWISEDFDAPLLDEFWFGEKS
jgi:hypothetical protein